MIKTMISHAEEDDAFVDYLFEKLNRANFGLDIFVDHKNNKTGDKAQDMIDEAKSSIIFVPVFSKQWNGSEFLKNELRAAQDSHVSKIFPIKLDIDFNELASGIKIEFKTPDHVDGVICTDFSDKYRWEIAIQELLKAIQEKLIQLDIFRKDEFFYQDVEHIDKIVARENTSPAEIKIIIDVFLKKEAYQYYFFKRLKQLRWLTFLRLYGFFDGNPPPIQVENQTGYYSMPRWSVLDYLERCSTQIKEDQNLEFGETLIDIIRSVSKYRDRNGNRVDNYITDWVFVKILANLPGRLVQTSDIEMVSLYLNSRWKATLVGPEIGSSLLPAVLGRGEKEKSTKLFDIATGVLWGNENRDSIPDSIIEAYWLNDLLERNEEKLADVCLQEAVEDTNQ